MLSVCIPVYQVDAGPLVSGLHDQATALDIPVEILCLDDASAIRWQELNRPLARLPLVRYEELPENLGRARIRNRLAREARFPYLLFLDSDARLICSGFLERYVALLPTAGLWCGGGAYQKEPPGDPRLWLHWYYGRRVEQQPVEKRRLAPYRGFKTFNFLVPREVILRLPFDESLRRYGHEDTLWGLMLEENGIPLRHLHNPLLHAGLEPVEEFLAKQRAAIEQLVVLEKKRPDLPVRLLEAGRKLKKWRVHGMVKRVLVKSLPALERFLLNQQNPVSLKVLSWYKLAYWLQQSD